jgi:transposase
MMSEKIRIAQGMKGARRASGIPCEEIAQGTYSMPSLPIHLPNPEVPDKATRRRFSAEYKLNILRQAEICRGTGDVGALLRREGLYSSHLTTWRRQKEAGILSGLRPKQRGRKANPLHPLQTENEQLRKENSRLQKRLKKAELIIDIQKKISQMLGIPLKNPELEEDD